MESKEQELTLKQSEMDRLNGKHETMASYNQTLEKDLAGVRGQMSSLTLRLESGAEKNVRDESAKNRAEVEIVDLRGNLSIAQDEAKRLGNELASCRKDLQAEQAKSQNMVNQNERMRSLLENLEQTKDELLQRL